MQQENAEKILVVLLDDMVQHSLPRILAIRHHIKQGRVLSDAEVTFFLEMLQKVNRCHVDYEHDSQCRVIFSTIAHLLFKVIRKALKNEKKHGQYANLAIEVNITQQQLAVT